MIVCKNCGKVFEGNYCPECGEKYDGASFANGAATDVTLPSAERKVTRGLAYERKGEDYCVVGFCECYDTDIVIPPFYNGRYVMSIGESTFAGCEALTSVVIPDTVGTIGDSAFHGCEMLSTVVMSLCVMELGERAFYGCSSLAFVELSGELEAIDEKTFFGCSSLESIVLPETLLYIGVSAFGNCFRLKTVYFSGTPDDWHEINIELFNDCLLSADLYFYSEETPSGKGEFWHYVNEEPAKWENEE